MIGIGQAPLCVAPDQSSASGALMSVFGSVCGWKISKSRVLNRGNAVCLKLLLKGSLMLFMLIAKVYFALWGDHGAY